MSRDKEKRTPKTPEDRGYQIIDIHAHPSVKDGGVPPVMRYALSLKKYLEPRWTGKSGNRTMQDLVEEMPVTEDLVGIIRKHGIKCTPVAWDAESATGEKPVSNDFVAKLVKEHPEAFMAAWGSVDPWKGVAALQEAERCIKELKLVGLKFQQASQRFHVNDKKFYPLWDLCQDLGAVVQFHSGYTGLGSGGPGGDGLYCMSYCRPIEIDEVAADFPRMKILLLHASEPWPWEANMVAIHKKNVVRETSGIWPRYFPHEMAYDMNRRLQDKFVFGSEWPYFDTDELLKQWEELDLRPGVLEKVMYKNILNFMGEELERAGADLSPWKGMY